MKKIPLLILLIFVFTKINAQDYQISFAGTGASSIVDSVKILNETTCTSLSMSGSDTLQLTVTVGIDELNSSPEKSLHIYPNPMTDNCTLDFEAMEQGQITIELYNVTGKIILQKKDYLKKGHHAYCLSGINSGVYFLSIKSDRYSYSTKLISNSTSKEASGIKRIEAFPNTDNTNSGKMLTLKSSKSLISMPYTNGNLLKLTGKSGNYRTVFMLVPTQSQTVTFNFVACTDGDGNNYSVVQIGTQMWMAENLKTTKYRNGDTIPYVTATAAWSALTSGAYCDANGVPANSPVYGYLYNWYAVNDPRMLAPLGWHIPTNTEGLTLYNYLGGYTVAGGKMKSKCGTIWVPTNISATNLSGFTAYPAGKRENNGSYYQFKYWMYFWNSNLYTPTWAWIMGISYNFGQSFYDYVDAKYGQSIRCVKN